MAAWSGWSLSNAGAPPVGYAGTPTIGSWGASRYDLFVRGNDQGLWHVWSLDGGATWHQWESFGGLLTAPPSVASWVSGRYDVFVRGNDGALFHKTVVASGNTAAWESLGGRLMDGTPSVTTWGVNRLDIFAVGLDNALWHKWFDGTWHDWESLGGTVTGTPAAVASAGNRIDVFVVGTNGGLFHKIFTVPTGWSGYTQLGVANGVPTSGWAQGIAAVYRTVSSTLDIFGVTLAQQMLHLFSFDGGVTFNQENLGGTLVSVPSAASDDRSGHVRVHVTGTDGRNYQNVFG